VASEPGFDLKKALQNDLKSLLASSGPPLTAPVVEIPETRAQTLLAASAPPQAAAKNLSLKPGDLLSAVATLAVDSDVPAPVLATVTLGPFKGAKLLGEFARGETGAILSFKKLIPQGQSPLAIEAVAIDPRTSKAAIASRVDTHFFERWGGLLASGFLEGLGTALRDRGGRVYANGEILIEEKPEKTLAEASLEALGQVGREAGTQFRKNFDRPPTIHVNAGQSLGVLILSLENPLYPSTLK
jgi:type IV secretory pathway VirB10-like protein